MLKLAGKNKGIFKVAAVNCDDEKEICGQFEIKGFPTIKVFPSEAVPVPKNKGGKGFHKVPEDYNGPRSAGGMAQAALNKMASFVQSVDDKSVDKFLETPDVAKVLLFTDKPKTTTLYKAISVEFHHRLAVGEVKQTAKETVEKYQVTKFPTLLVVSTSGEKVTYDGELKLDKIQAFLKTYAKPAPKAAGAPTEPEKPKVPEVNHPVSEEVKDQETFEKICHSSSKMCMIALLDPQDTEAETHATYLQTLEKVSQKAKDLLHVIWIDGPKNWEYAEKLGLAYGYPAVVTYAHKKSAKIPFMGSFTEDDLSDYVKTIRAGGRRVSSVTSFPKLKSAQKKEEVKQEVKSDEPKKSETKDEL